MPIRTRSVRPAGIRRCGVRHTAEPTIWPVGQFTAEQIRILKADPDLVVEEVEGAGDGAAGDGPALESKTVAELRELAAELGIDLEKIKGTGKGGNVVKDDIVRAIRAEQAGSEGEPPRPTVAPSTTPPAGESADSPAPTGDAGDGAAVDAGAGEQEEK